MFLFLGDCQLPIFVYSYAVVSIAHLQILRTSLSGILSVKLKEISKILITHYNCLVYNANYIILVESNLLFHKVNSR